MIAIEAPKAKELLSRLHESGLVHAAFIGHVKSKGSGKIFVETDNTQQIPYIEPIEDVSTETEDSSNPTDPDLSEGLDAYTKRAIHIALSVSSQSQSNLKTHIEKARTMGYNQVEIDEAAQIAIDIGDPSIEKFYKKFKAL